MLKTKSFEANSHLVAFAIIFLVTFSIYSNSLQGGFIWDDKGIILDHTGYLEDWRNLFSAFTKPFFGETPFYRPLLIVSFIVDYQLWGSHPFGFHYTNILLHTINAFMVFLLAFTLFKDRYLSLFSSLLFATHPIQTEAVAWISGRNDVFLTFFLLLTLIFYLRWQNIMGGKRILNFIGFLMAYGCALLTKEGGIIVFLLIVLIGYFFRTILPARVDGKRIAYLSMILVSLLYIYLRMNILGGIGLGNIREDITSRVLGIFVVYAYYFKMLLFPIHQTANPFIPYLTSVRDHVFVSSFFLIISLVLITVACWKHFRELSFIILWIFITLLPVSGIVPLTVPALEHRLYLGSVGFSILLPLLIYKVSYLKNNGNLFKRKGTVMISFLLMCIISIYCYKTVIRNTIWKDESHFWLNTVKESPFSVFAHNNLGLIYAKSGQYSQAIEEFEKTLLLNINPRIANEAQRRCQRSVSYNNLGHLYYQALEENQKTARIKSEGASAKTNLVVIHGEEGLYQKSLDNYRKALQLDPDNAKAHNNLGDLYYLKKSYQLAAKEYKLAIKYNPYYAEAYNNLGLVHSDEKRYDDAREKFLKALKLKPHFAEASNNLALAYFNSGMYQEAKEEFHRALKLMPKNGDIHFNLALVYLKGFKNRKKAVDCLRESLRIDPHHSRAAEIKEVLAKLKSDKVSGE